jgi:hypothetical protein
MRRLFLLILLILAGCDRSNNVLPTVVEPNAAGTALMLTEFAPPLGYDTIAVPRLDARTEELAGWRAEMNFSFNGVYARTPRTTAASIQAVVYYDQVGSARRVVATVDNDLEEAAEAIQFEGVQLGTDVFLVRDERCILASEADAAIIADLSAGDLIGGVQNANVQPEISTINGEEVWLYSFDAADVILPNLTIPADGRILSMNGELWYAPARNVVIRFYLILQVENALLLEQSLPVTGEVIMSYDLFDIGLVPNITQPNGC